MRVRALALSCRLALSLLVALLGVDAPLRYFSARAGIAVC